MSSEEIKEGDIVYTASADWLEPATPEQHAAATLDDVVIGKQVVAEMHKVAKPPPIDWVWGRTGNLVIISGHPIRDDEAESVMATFDHISEDARKSPVEALRVHRSWLVGYIGGLENQLVTIDRIIKEGK